MKPFIKALLFVCTVLLLASCAAVPEPSPQYGVYGEKAIKIHMIADPQLNLYQGSPHTLLACVYQLNSRNGFNQLSGDQEGLYKLLECQRFDASVTNVERLIIYPGQNTTVSLDRAEGTRYVAIITGYNDIRKPDIMRLFDIPVTIKRKSLFSMSKVAEIGTLAIDLILGPEQITN